MELDNIHYSFNSIDGYNKPFNFIVSPREDGKTTSFLVRKSYPRFKKTQQPTIILRRYTTDITDAYIQSLEDVINKFSVDKIKLNFKHGLKKEGVVDVLINKVVFFRIIAINNPISRIKSLFLANAAFLFFDEFICNTRLGEKYLKAESFKVKEIVNTFQREADNLRSYFCGNPYSLYNPYFVDFGIDPKKLIKGTVITGANWAAERHILNPLLIEKIKEHNPLYSSTKDDAYERYAVEGEATNDSNANILDSCPANFSLYVSFRIDNKIISVYENNEFNFSLRFWIGYNKSIGNRRFAYCFDFNNLNENSILFSREDKFKLNRLKQAIRTRLAAYESLEISYLMEEIYQCL